MKTKVAMFSGIEFFYLVCAGTGLLFTLFAAISGHHPHAGGHGGHFGFRGGHGHAGHLGIKAGPGSAGARGAGRAGAGHGPRGPSRGGQRVAGETESQVARVSFLSPLTAALFVGSLGFLGIIALRGLKLTSSESFVFAAPLALLNTVLVFYMFVRLFVSSQSSSVFSQDDCVGLEAQVVTKIEPGRLGSVAYVDKGKRLTLPARADDDQGFGRGDRVYIVGFDENTALVRSTRGQLWGE